MNKTEIFTAYTDWALRPNCISEIYLTTEQQEEVFQWLMNNRKAERKSVIDLISVKFSDDQQLLPFGY
jgi:hypothetical protein